MNRYARRAALAVLAAAVLAACGDSGGGEQSDRPSCEVTLPPDGQPFETLSEYCFFRGDPAAQEPSEGVVPYDVNTRLYSDRSLKFRFIVLPDGGKITFHENDKWEFPKGTTIVKTFYFPNDARDPSKGRHLIETRLLVRGETEWESQIYRWNDEQTEAERYLVGKSVEVDWTDADGESVTSSYKIPAKSDCKNCHDHSDKIVLLGPRTRQLNRPNDYGDGPVNQITHIKELGLFAGEVPSPDGLPKLIDPTDDSYPIEQRARTYLEGNCAHCHNPDGPARNSALFLNIEQDDPRHYGVCKPPIAAGGGTGGRPYDIYPGDPDRSIMVFRLDSLDPQIKMPELPLRTVDQFGLDLVTQWIESMDGECVQ